MFFCGTQGVDRFAGCAMAGLGALTTGDDCGEKDHCQTNPEQWDGAGADGAARRGCCKQVQGVFDAGATGYC